MRLSLLTLVAGAAVVGSAAYLLLFASQFAKSGSGGAPRLIRVWTRGSEPFRLEPRASYVIDLQGPALTAEQRREIVELAEKTTHPGEHIKVRSLNEKGQLSLHLRTSSDYSGQAITIGSTMAIGPYFSFQVVQVAQFSR